jgi:hypothetical protein
VVWVNNTTEPTWTIAEGNNQGRPLIARFNTAFKDVAARGGRGIQIGVAIPFKKPRADGLPESTEATTLATIEDAVVREAADRALLVGVITTGGMREFVLYTATGEWIASFHKALQAAVTTHEVQMSANHDRAWSVYTQFVV